MGDGVCFHSLTFLVKTCRSRFRIFNPLQLTFLLDGFFVVGVAKFRDNAFIKGILNIFVYVGSPRLGANYFVNDNVLLSVVYPKVVGLLCFHFGSVLRLLYKFGVDFILCPVVFKAIRLVAFPVDEQVLRFKGIQAALRFYNFAGS